ncbi:MAG: bestrophin family protein [Bacteroidota bacterium]
MLTYNSKEWFKPLIYFHKGDTFRKLWLMLVLVAIYTVIVAYVETHFLQISENEHVKNIPIMHSLLGFAISMLLVFRTNTAYDRWWEGRKLWGSLVNASRNLAVKLDAILPMEDKANRNYFSSLIALYPRELQQHLQQEKTRLELDDKPHPEIPGFDRSRHVPSQIISHIQRRVKSLLTVGTISKEELYILNTDLTAFLDICGGCERIKNTPIPYSYSSFIKKFIFIYVLTLPLGFVFSLGYIAVPVVVFIFYVLASLEVIAEEIEEPFGIDTNDLPMARLTETIGKNVHDILH